MLIKIYRILLLFLFFNFYVFYCYADILAEKEKVKRFNNKVYYGLAQNYFNENNYLLSDYMFDRLVRNNEIYNKYSCKSKIYSALSKFKRGKHKSAKKLCKNILAVKHVLDIKCLNYTYFLKGVILFSPSKNLFFSINRYKADQTFVKKAFNSFSKVNASSIHTAYKQLVIDVMYKVEVEIKKNRLYLAHYYFKKGAYISVIKRLHHFNHNCKDEYDLQNNYLLLKSYNELYLSDIPKKLLTFEPSKYFKQRIKKMK